jgi:fumarate hydratase subunit alpha
MREITASEITKTVANLCQEANYVLGEDAISALKQALEVEESILGREIISQLLENAEVAKKERVPLCQDCGTAIVFLEIGQDVHIIGGALNTAVEKGVRQGYKKGSLRKSMVKQPFSKRKNTQDNTPPVIHIDLVPGDKLKITVMAKGCGAENMSRLMMLNPGDGVKGIVDAVLRTVGEAGGNACPPIVVGLGIGANMEKAMLLAKKSLLRPVYELSNDSEVADLELEVLGRVNDLGIGPMGYGGRITALAVHAEVLPTHMGGLPVAINLQCHSSRHMEKIL